MKPQWIMAGFCLCLLVMQHSAQAQSRDAPESVRLVTPLSSPVYPVVLTGAMVPALQEIPTGALRVYARHGEDLRVIASQIDLRDQHGELQLARPAATARMDDNDECVLLAGDAGERLDAATQARMALTEITLQDPRMAAESWVYIRAGDEPLPPALLRYDARSDSVETVNHRLRFSEKTPMLLADLHWRDPGRGAWSADLLDTMKVRHTGHFLGQAFWRSDADYDSRLTGVKAGPVRVIRRTDNRIALFMGLKSPSIRIDMLIYPAAMVADMRLTVPFPVGWFFSDVVTTTSLDGRRAAGVMQSLHAGTDTVGINGRMDAAKQALNAAGHPDFAVVDRFGAWAAGVQLPPELPIRSRVKLVDDMLAEAQPEDEIGQFGNVGFELTGWEALRGGTYRLRYQVYLLPGASAATALEVLRQGAATVARALP